MTPLVSIVIPVKNRESIVVETITSVQNQSHKNIEIIVIDDLSTDSTVEVVMGMSECDKRIRLLRNTKETSGAPACRNIGWRSATGKYLIFLDSDDLLSTCCIEERVKYFEQNPDLDFLVFQVELFEKTPGDTKLYWNYFSAENDLDRFLRVDAPFHTMGPIWRAESINKINGWDESVITWQDWEFHIRALIANLKYKKIPISDSYYRTNTGISISSGDQANERIVFFPRLYCQIYNYLKDRSLLTQKREIYFYSLFIRLPVVSRERFGVYFIYSKIMKNAVDIGLMSKFEALEISLVVFLRTHFVKSKIVKKIAWRRLRHYHDVQRESSGIHRSKVLVA